MGRASEVNPKEKSSSCKINNHLGQCSRLGSKAIYISSTVITQKVFPRLNPTAKVMSFLDGIKNHVSMTKEDIGCGFTQMWMSSAESISSTRYIGMNINPDRWVWVLVK